MVLSLGLRIAETKSRQVPGSTTQLLPESLDVLKSLRKGGGISCFPETFHKYDPSGWTVADVELC